MSEHAPSLTYPVPHPVTAPPRLHLAFLDGLRAVAALLVAFSHLWGVELHHPVYPGVRGFLTNWLDSGHLWVNCFIVLSGFCLMLPVTRSGALRGGWLTFYKSRARRILPPLYAVIALAIAKTLVRDHSIPLSTVLINVFLLQDVLQISKALNAPLWTVALEWKIYFLFPVLVWLWGRYGYLLTFLAAAALSLALILIAPDIPALTLYRACPWYVLLFTLGMASAGIACRSRIPVHLPRTAWILLGVTLVLDWAQMHLWFLVPPVPLLTTLHWPFADTLDGFTFSLLLFLLTRASIYGMTTAISPLLAVLSWGPLVFIGSFAYSIYLTHFLVMYAINDALVSLLHTRIIWIIGPIDMVLTVCAAYLFYLTFERPFMTRPGVKIRTEAQAEAAAIVSPAP